MYGHRLFLDLTRKDRQQSSKQHVAVYHCIPREDGLRAQAGSDNNDEGEEKVHDWFFPELLVLFMLRITTGI
jgi:hypothetical protein